MTSTTEPVPICQSDPDTFWPWLTWAEFSRLDKKEDVLVVVPIAGYCDWGLGHALDAEESVLMPILAQASRLRAPQVRLLVVPPLRFVAGPGPRSAFAVDAPTTHAFLADVCASVQAAGFSRIVFFNASPWNEEIVDAAARDLRIDRGLQMFCVNLSALGLDFRADRGGDRAKLRCLLDGLHPSGSASGDGAAVLVEAARHLASLFSEIAARPPLPRGGRLISPMQP
ncbi:MAG: creatininase family protein [Opitutaceae bacterium]|nr:creatininase family protein [Opitutaceae bacterium]